MIYLGDLVVNSYCKWGATIPVYPAFVIDTTYNIVRLVMPSDRENDVLVIYIGDSHDRSVKQVPAQSF